MELRDYLRVARRHWWVMALTVLLALLVAGAVTARTKPVYAATLTFFASTTSADPTEALSGATFVQTRLKTYAALLTSDRMAESLAADSRLGLTPAQIKERITVLTEGDSVLIEVTVTDGSPERALLLANAITPQFEAVVRSVETPPGQQTAAARVDALEAPRLNGAPVSPRPVHNAALAVAVGLILGAALAVAREVADGAVRSSAQLEDLTAVPVLAEIPAGRRFIAASGSPRAEALRRLRTNLAYAGGPVRTLAITSAMPGEGRSATACGLAILLAESGQRVLIVDAELRRPRLAALLGREGSAGLTSVLLGAASLDQVLQPWGSGLWLLAGGHRPPNPSELLGSPRMTELLDELRTRFDTVILDAPPLLPVTDGAVLAARVDGVLLLVRSGRTTAAQVTTAVRALRAVDAKLIGCVVTMSGGPGLLRRLFEREPPGPARPAPRQWNMTVAAT